MDSTLEQAMLQGLTEQEARERLATDGYNELFCREYQVESVMKGYLWRS